MNNSWYILGNSCWNKNMNFHEIEDSAKLISHEFSWMTDFLQNLSLFFSCAIRFLCIFAPSFCPKKGEWQTYLKKRRCTTLYLRLLESSKFKSSARWSKANAHVFWFWNSVGYGIAYPRMIGSARASSSGMSDSSDTRASFFGVFWE